MPARSRSPSSTRWAITSTSCYAWTMRRALVLVVLFGCAGASSHEPAWPKPHVSDNDGGESLAPHQAHQVAAVSKDDDAEAKPAAPAAEGTAPKTPEAATPAVTAPNQAPTDETINTEEIIIEIDD